MKLYESAYTYFPFLYLYFFSSFFGALYHNLTLELYQPYIILVFTLFNTLVFNIHDTDIIIKHAVHRHIWQTITLCIYGIMLNNTHTEMLRDFHFTTDSVNFCVSSLYIVLIWVVTYYYEYIGGGVVINMIFLFFPLQRVWQINLYMYVVYTTLGIILMYRRIKISLLEDMKIYINPVVKFFMYLRIHDYLIFMGVFQIYLEYYKSILPEKRAMENIAKVLESEREKRRNDYFIDKELESIIEKEAV